MTEVPIPNEGPQKVPVLTGALRDKTKLEVSQLLKAPRWRALAGDEIVREDEELQRTAREMQLDYGNLVHAFQNAQLEELSDTDWTRMENTDSIGDWTKDEVIENIGSNRDHARIFHGIENGEDMPAPIVLFRNGESPYLIGGNTRLMACKALGIRPVVLAIHM